MRLPDPKEALRRRGAHWTFDAHGFVQLVQRIRQQYYHPNSANADVLYAPSFDHAKGDPVPDDIEIRSSFVKHF